MNTHEKRFQEIIHREKPPYYQFLGIDIIDVKWGFARLKMNYDPKLTNPYGFVNGGFFSVLADAATACALLGMTEEDRRLVTLEYKLNLLVPFREGFIISDANIIHLGKETAVGEVDIRDQTDTLVGKALITYAIKGGREKPG